MQQINVIGHHLTRAHRAGISLRIRLRALAIGIAFVCAVFAFLMIGAGRANAAAPDRAAMSPLGVTVIVTNTSDSGVGSLRAAVDNAAAGDTITFTANVSGVITLSDTIRLNRNVTIAGPGADKLAVSGDNKYRIFWGWTSAKEIAISDLTLRDGWTSGAAAALISQLALTLTNVNFLSNTAAQAGAIVANGGIVLNGGVFRNNYSTAGDSGALLVSGPFIMSGTQFISNTAAYGYGGAVNVTGGATVTGGEFRSNYSSLDGGGLYVYGLLSMTGTSFISNTAANDGGGLYVYGSAVPSITGGVFQNNRAIRDGGGFYTIGGAVITGTSFISNTAGRTGGGAMIYWGFARINGGLFERNMSIVDAGGGIRSVRELTITGTQFISNAAGTAGGAVYDNTAVTITMATLNGNQAGGSGGALWYRDNGTIVDTEMTGNTAGTAGGALQMQGNLILIACTLAWNRAPVGGAIHNMGLRMVISNSTISSNHAITGGAISQEIYAGYMQTLIVNSTIVSNSADMASSSGIRVQSGIMTVTNSILANAGGNNVQLVTGGVFTSAGHNVVNGVITRALSSDLLNTDPLVGPLRMAPGNGRAPLMHALLPGSPAIDAGDGSACPPADQRGIDRPLIDGCDIGAYESRGFVVNAQGEPKQATPINAPFTAPLSASISSPYAEPVDGGRLVFTPHPNTHGASTASPVYTATILSGGAAQSVNANGIGGTYTVTAMARGVYTPATYTLTNLIAQLDMSATPDLLLANGVSTSLVTVVASDQDQALAGYAIILTATKGHFTSDIGTQSIMITTDVAGVATAAFTAYSTPGVGIVKAVLAVTPAISRSVAITLVTPTTGLAGQLRKQFGGVITYTWVVTNLGPAPALYVVITGVVPANTRVLTDRVSGGAWDGANGIVTSTASLAVNETLAVTYAVEPINRTGNILAYAEAVSANSAYVGTNTDILTRSFLMKVMRE